MRNTRHREENRRKRRWATAVGLCLAMLVSLSAEARAQTSNSTAESSSTSPSSSTSTVAAVESATNPANNYTIQQSIEIGYRDSMIGGNINNYDTFENLGSGPRLLNYTLSMHAVNHKGILFDDLSFSSFGYGGDPNDVSRLSIDKNKWYDFRAMFRRDKNFWDYSLLANPLNPTGSNPTVAVLSSPQALDLTRWMQDYDLTLMPQSRFRLRLGYSRNTNQGPATSSVEGGTEPLLSQLLLYQTNSYRIGFDYTGIAKTTLSFDELITASNVNETETDNNRNFQLSSGTPVDLGLVFNTVGSSPCAVPITNAATTPPTVSPTCNEYVTYSEFQNPRSSFPTERFRFESTYIKNFTMAGSIGYTDGNNAVNDFSELINGWASRTVGHGSTAGGPTLAKRISIDANWTGDYRLTDKLDISDEFSFEDWRIPSTWATADTNLFGTPPQVTGQAGALLPIAMVTPATYATVCPTAPYNQTNCPQHTSSSGADITNELVSQFLGQDAKTNTIELKYDLAPKVSAYVGYMYMARAISDFSATFDAGEIYFPGGATGSVMNDFLAARGDCALVVGHLPAGCVLNPNGSIQEGTSTLLVPEAANDTARNLTEIHESAGMLGISARPTDTLRLNADLMFGYNDNSFTRISPRQVQSYKVHASYTPKPWASIDGAIDINENRDNVFTVDNIEHARVYSFVTTLSAKSNLWVDFGYNYMDIYTQTEICFADTGSTVFTSACPVTGATGPLGTLSFYATTDHYAYADVMWKPVKRVTVMMGYAGTIARGTTTMLNPLTPTGTLDFDYLKPRASLAIDLYKGVTYKTAWNYYGYDDHGVANPVGLAPIPLQNFNGSNITFSLLYLIGAR
ncbi:MAG: hypothetical protein WA871_15205 [Candidatus Acidiferrales bacterium]